MNVTIEDYLDNHAFCDCEGNDATIFLEKEGTRYNLDSIDFDDFYGDYVNGVEVSIDGNEFGVWLHVVIELE
ncbi:MAG: hypothetical protein U0O30_07095 [Streptococcus sp.]|uniref:hypothetical protein n=1 Tax=Streptococcus sp. TaxID=1306 RepID=UPI002F957F36